MGKNNKDNEEYFKNPMKAGDQKLDKIKGGSYPQKQEESRSSSGHGKRIATSAHELDKRKEKEAKNLSEYGTRLPSENFEGKNPMHGSVMKDADSSHLNMPNPMRAVQKTKPTGQSH